MDEIIVEAVKEEAEEESYAECSQPEVFPEINHFCRLCLHTSRTLFPLASRINDVMIPDMVRTVTGIRIDLRSGLPTKLCIECVKKLDNAFNIRKEFVQSDRLLRGFAKSKLVSLLDSLQQYQKDQNVDVSQMRLTKREEDLASLNVEELIQPLVEASDKEDVDYDNEESTNEAKDKHSEDENELELICDVEEISNEELFDQSDENRSDLEEDAKVYKPKESVLEIEANNSQVAYPDKRRKHRQYNLAMKESDLHPNKCYICETMLANANELSVHLASHVDMIPYDCQQCTNERGNETKKITSLILLQRHFRMHSGSIKCPQCSFRTCKSYGLYSHMKVHHAEDAKTEYACELCGRKLVGRNRLNGHMNAHKAVAEGRYQCSVCDKRFSTKTRLNRHERYHTNEKPYGCHYCPKSFSTKTTLQMHERVHTGERGFLCDICDKAFTCRSYLQNHIAAVHAIGEKQKKISSAQSAQNNNHSAKPLKCDVEGCEFVTNVRSQYYTHKAKHELKFHCTFCERRFATRQLLESHETFHTGQKQFSCELCGKNFRFRNSLVEHMNVHTNNRPHQCEECGASFVRERTLKEHRRKHSDALNYQCRYCEKKFKYRADQSKHERIHATDRAEKATGAHQQEEVIDFEIVEGMEVIEEEALTDY